MNQEFYLTKEEPHKSCFLAMRSFLLKVDEDITETQKYGMPCFCYKGKICCYLWQDKKTKEPYFLWANGALDHPSLEKGKRSKMKILRIDPEKDLPITLISSILEQAMELSGSASKKK